MPWFKCFVAGRNFPGDLIGKSSPVGFYTTLYIEAASHDYVEEKVLVELRSDDRLKLPQDFGTSLASEVYFEEIVEVPVQDVPDSKEGFVWYVMDESDAG